MAGGGDLSRAWRPLMQRRQTKARLYFPLRDLEQSEYNSGGRSHRTAWANSRRPQLEVRGHEIIARIGSYQYGGNLFAQSRQIVVQIKATHLGHVEVDNQAAGAAQFG